VNPDRLISPKMQTDYSFMLVGTPIGAPLNSWAGQKWGVDSFDNVQLYSDWYAKIYCEKNDSYVVFPNQSLFFHFDPRSEYNCGKNFDSANELERTLFEGKSITLLDRDLKILISDLSADEVLKYMRDYKRRFTAK